MTTKATSLMEGLIEDAYVKGAEDAIAIIEERGKKIQGAIQPGRTIQQIRERLLSFVE